MIVVVVFLPVCDGLQGLLLDLDVLMLVEMP